MERKNQEVEKMNNNTTDDVLKKSKKEIEKWKALQAEAKETVKLIQGWGGVVGNIANTEWMIAERKKLAQIERQAKADIEAWVRIKHNTKGETSRAAHDIIVAASSAMQAVRKAAEAVEAYIMAEAVAEAKTKEIYDMLHIYGRIDDITEKSQKAVEKWQTIKAEAEKATKTIRCWQSMWPEAGDGEIMMQERQKWVDIEMRAIVAAQAWEIVNRDSFFKDIAQAAKDVIAAATAAAQAAREARAEVDAYMITAMIATEKYPKLAKLLNL